MPYFITGGTGFIGRHLVKQLLPRGERVYVLVRAGSRARFERLARDCADRGGLLSLIEGDLGAPGLGVSAADRDALLGRITHFFHLGALYDLSAQDAELTRSNVAGTQHALEFAHEARAGCFHFMSSIAAAGRFPGVFTEEMFEQAGALDHPYFRTKHDAEALVRAACRVPWRIYRPGMVVGDSHTGEMDKIDGPYYLFKLIQRVRDALPRWTPLIGAEGGYANIVPVDFVAAALDHLAHVPGEDGRCFHLTDPHNHRVGEAINLFAAAAHAPTLRLRVDSHLSDALAASVRMPREALAPLRRALDALLAEAGIPPALVRLFNQPTVFTAERAQSLLEPAGIRVPPLADYAWRLWDFWERRLDPELNPAARLRRAVDGKTILVTGGSSGIGRATALKLAAAGARIVLVARDADKLEQARSQILAGGGCARIYSCDLAEPAACAELLVRLAAEQPPIDILINNAGRSIRRGIDATYERFHDYERLMRINYFGAVRLTLGLLPSMAARGAGHIISISSLGVLTNASRFAAYNASKAALEAFTRCAAGEFADRGVRFTVVNLPLVRTPMSAPTKIYDAFKLLEPEQAAEMVCDAVVRRPERVTTGLGTLAHVVEALAPRVNRAVMSESYRMYPDSRAAGGPAGQDDEMSRDARRLSAVLRDLHF